MDERINYLSGLIAYELIKEQIREESGTKLSLISEDRHNKYISGLKDQLARIEKGYLD